MTDSSSITYAPASILSGHVNPSTFLEDSRVASWHSVYLRHDRSQGLSDEYEVPSTPDHRVVVILEGQCELTVFAGGRARVVRRGAGSMGMTPGGESSRLRWRSGGPDVSFESGHLYLPQPIIEAAVDHYRRAGDAVDDAALRNPAFDDPAVAAVVSAMVRAMYAGAPDLYAETAAQWLAVHLLARTSPWRQRVADGRKPGNLSDARLSRVLEFMRDNLSYPPTLDELAAEAGFSKFHFARVFKRRTGETPVGCLTRLRLEAACRLLAFTDEAIAEVAATCGYTQLSHFDAVFRRRYGHSPSQMRRSSRR